MSDEQVLTCEEAIELLAAYIDDELKQDSSADLERHLDRCRSCYSRHQFERTLKQQISRLAREPVRPEFESRIRTLVSRFAADREHDTT